jgi:hypothetical protein
MSDARGAPIPTPARELPGPSTMHAAAALLGLQFEQYPDVPGGADSAYLGGHVRAVADFWDAWIRSQGTNDQQHAFRSGWVDAHDRDARMVMATLAHNVGRAAAVAAALKSLDDEDSDAGGYLVPLTVAAAAALVAEAALSLAVLLGTTDHDDLPALEECAEDLQTKLRSFSEQIRMSNELLALQRQHRHNR